ncbi:MAG: hypothetical protein ABI831_26830, partial [Betaproteobacteria bacterium]
MQFGLTVDPRNPDIVYAASAGGVFKSVSGGVTWNRSSKGINDLFEVHSLAIDPSNSSILYAGTVDTID